MTVASDDLAISKRRSGFRLLTMGLLMWMVSMVAIHVTIARDVGYGLGIRDGGRVPPAVVADAKVGPRAADVVRATSDNIGPIGIGDAAWRLLVSVTALIGIVAFWFVVISRIGVF